MLTFYNVRNLEFLLRFLGSDHVSLISLHEVRKRGQSDPNVELCILFPDPQVKLELALHFIAYLTLWSFSPNLIIFEVFQNYSALWNVPVSFYGLQSK